MFIFTINKLTNADILIVCFVPSIFL